LHAEAIENMPNATLAGVWSRTQNVAEKFAMAYDVNSYREISSLVRNEGIDVGIVCNAHPFHREVAVEAAKLGVNILVEKPLASTLTDCDRMIKACREAGVTLGVVSQRRFYEPVQRMRRAVDEGKLGEPAIGTINMLGWRDMSYYDADPWRGTWETEGGGVLVNQAPHQLDLLLWFMGEVKEVYGIWNNINHPRIEVDDTAAALVKFKNGGIGNIMVSNAEKPGLFGKVQIHGKNGASVGVQTDGGAMFIAGMTQVLEPPVNDLWTVPGEEGLLAGWVREDTALFERIDPPIYYMEKQLADFLQALDEGREPSSNGEAGRRTVELFTGIYRSTRDNKPIRFPLTPEGNSNMDGRLRR